MNKKKAFCRKTVLFTLAIVLSISLASCGGAPAQPAIAEVATAVPSATLAPSNTPAPTSTSTPVPTVTPTPTKVPTATPNRTATAAFQKTATQAAIDEMVGAELTKYGIDPSKGHVA